MKYSFYIILIAFTLTSCNNSSKKNEKGFINEYSETYSDEELLLTNEDQELDETYIEEEELIMIEDSKRSDIFNFQEVDSQPLYSGCDELGDEKDKFRCFKEKLKQLLKSNFKYPKTALENNISGRVIISFVISKKGNVKDIKVIRSIDKSIDEEAIRLVSLIPKMSKPALHNEVPVPVAFILPITFKPRYPKVEYKEKSTINIEYKIYPIPAHDYLNIEITPLNLKIDYKIVNLNGQIVKIGELFSSNERINIYELNKGNYIIQFVDKENNLITNKRFIVE